MAMASARVMRVAVKAPMMRVAVVAVMAAVALSAAAWSQKGHDVVAHIAERHLTPSTQAAVDSLLEGRHLVYWANWLDNASHTPEYAYTKTWHYRNVDEGQTLETAPENPNGDVIKGIRYAVRVLSDSSQTQANRLLALKILVHLVGDMHQPMHMGHLSDLGGNRTKVKYFGRDTNLHSVWDGSLVESAHKWSYTEWADQIDLPMKPEQQALLLSGNVADWARRGVENAAEVYRATPDGTSLSYNDVARWTPMIEESLLLGGHRLAHILNSIFDPTYPYRRTPAAF